MISHFLVASKFSFLSVPFSPRPNVPKIGQKGDFIAQKQAHSSMLSLSSTMHRFVKLPTLFAFEFTAGTPWPLTVQSGDFCGPHDN